MRSSTFTLVALALTGPITLLAQPAMKKYNPPGVYAPKAYSQVAEVPGGMRLLLFSGMVAQDLQGAVLHPGDLPAQTRAVFQQLTTQLQAVGATWNDVAKMTQYVVGLTPEALLQVRAVRAEFLPMQNPPASTLVGVTALYDPQVLIEVELMVALPVQ